MFLGHQQTLSGAFPEASLREKGAITAPSFSLTLTLGLRSRVCASVHAANNLGHSMKYTLCCYCWFVGNNSGLAR